jgi:hypothetical protein
METYQGVEVELHAILASALYKGEERVPFFVSSGRM